jgi:hypothetical protein
VKTNSEMVEETKRYKKGHFIGLGIAIGIPIGVPIGLALGNIAYGPAIGLPIGLLIGYLMEKNLNKNPVPISYQEERKIKKWLMIASGFGLVLFFALLALYFLK